MLATAPCATNGDTGLASCGSTLTAKAMHELGIANSVIDAVRAEALRHPGSRAVRVGMRIGELAGVNAESLAFCFQALVRDTELAGMALEIERAPRKQRCDGCRTTFEAADGAVPCPSCGRTDTAFAGGDELEVAWVELEEP